MRERTGQNGWVRKIRDESKDRVVMTTRIHTKGSTMSNKGTIMSIKETKKARKINETKIKIRTKIKVSKSIMKMQKY